MFNGKKNEQKQMSKNKYFLFTQISKNFLSLSLLVLILQLYRFIITLLLLLPSQSFILTTVHCHKNYHNGERICSIRANAVRIVQVGKLATRFFSFPFHVTAPFPRKHTERTFSWHRYFYLCTLTLVSMIFAGNDIKRK